MHARHKFLFKVFRYIVKSNKDIFDKTDKPGANVTHDYLFDAGNAIYSKYKISDKKWELDEVSNDYVMCFYISICFRLRLRLLICWIQMIWSHLLAAWNVWLLSLSTLIQSTLRKLLRSRSRKCCASWISSLNRTSVRGVVYNLDHRQSCSCSYLWIKFCLFFRVFFSN